MHNTLTKKLFNDILQMLTVFYNEFPELLQLLLTSTSHDVQQFLILIGFYSAPLMLYTDAVL